MAALRLLIVAGLCRDARRRGRFWTSRYGGVARREQRLRRFGILVHVGHVDRRRLHTQLRADWNLGAVKCWGHNSVGQLGDGTDTQGQLHPGRRLRALPSGVTAIAVGDLHSCALTSGGGGLKCWGDNYFGQRATRHRQRPIPVDISGQSGA